MNRQLLLKLVLWLICVYHVVLGVAAFLSEDWAVQLARAVFGIEVEPTPQLSYIVKLLGVYASVFGLMVAIAAREPARYPAILNVVVILYGLRILNRLVHFDQYTTAFSTTSQRVWMDVALLAAFGGAVLLLKPRGKAGA